MKTRVVATLVAGSVLGLPAIAAASPNIAGGFWASWRYNTTDDTLANEVDSETFGDIGREALILYLDSSQDDGPWTYSGEVRWGDGSFTNPDINSTGENWAVHKAWIGYDLSDRHNLKIGKSQVPFGWKTVNFWPGDGHLGGYADQMDVGVKYTGDFDALAVSAAYNHQDDWDEASTDTVDDNGHWGDLDTNYRKIQTLVGDVNYTLGTGEMTHKFGVSLQAGQLQDLAERSATQTCLDSDPPTCTVDDYDSDNGSHSAGVLYYVGNYGPFVAKAQVIQVSRELPDNAVDPGDETSIENSRFGLEGQYNVGNWSFYVDLNGASTDTDGNDADSISSIAPGVRYDYGPGWIYAEYIDQDGYIGADGDVHEGDFSSAYVTMDYYF